jgi:hypothetical protein
MSGRTEVASFTRLASLKVSPPSVERWLKTSAAAFPSGVGRRSLQRTVTEPSLSSTARRGRSGRAPSGRRMAAGSLQLWPPSVDFLSQTHFGGTPPGPGWAERSKSVNAQ